jgi:hypothetical protein
VRVKMADETTTPTEPTTFTEPVPPTEPEKVIPSAPGETPPDAKNVVEIHLPHDPTMVVRQYVESPEVEEPPVEPPPGEEPLP